MGASKETSNIMQRIMKTNLFQMQLSAVLHAKGI